MRQRMRKNRKSFLVSQEVENNKEVGTPLKNMPLVTLLV